MDSVRLFLRECKTDSNFGIFFFAGKVWALNFLSEQEALEFLSFCEVSDLLLQGHI